MAAVTGPNGSGKSILVRQICLIVFLAHIGSFVPAESAAIPRIDSILTVFNGGRATGEPFSSAFTDDLSALSAALRRATPRSLVAVDEFGRGSNPDDSSALLAGFLRHLSSMPLPPLVLVSTHFRAALDAAPPGALSRWAMRVSVSQGGLAFRFEAAEERDAGSFGLECARMCGVPAGVVERAREVQSTLARGEEVAAARGVGGGMSEAAIRKALGVFFRWDGSGNPRALLAAIEAAALT